jgi:predicted MPP superfamily phosphohydrolase
MGRLLNPFVIVLTAIIAVAYAYVAWRLAPVLAARIALAVPFALIWIVPVVYWVLERESAGRADDVLHGAAYLSMGWLSFLVLLALLRDLIQGAAWLLRLEPLHAQLDHYGSVIVFALSLAALGAGVLAAYRGPRVRHVDVPIRDLDPALHGLRIAQISDLHVGPTIRARYVRRVVRLTNALNPDLIALTGDMVDGLVPRLAEHVAPLAQLEPKGRAFLALGNHDYYSGAGPWIAHFREMGLTVLLNEHTTVRHGDALIVIGGVVDPAARMTDRSLEPRPDLAAAPDVPAAFRLLLAHNPKLAPLGAAAGFDLQLSGHTHAGQFFPWTLAVRLVHGPHVAGLSRRDRMWVYVNAGTGTWGPPVRFGTEPELTLLRLVPADGTGAPLPATSL